jgi:hypothetical protein
VPVLALLRLVFYEWRKRSAVSGAPQVDNAIGVS